MNIESGCFFFVGVLIYVIIILMISAAVLNAPKKQEDDYYNIIKLKLFRKAKVCCCGSMLDHYKQDHVHRTKNYNPTNHRLIYYDYIMII